MVEESNPSAPSYFYYATGLEGRCRDTTRKHFKIGAAYGNRTRNLSLEG